MRPNERNSERMRYWADPMHFECCLISERHHDLLLRRITWLWMLVALSCDLRHVLCVLLSVVLCFNGAVLLDVQLAMLLWSYFSVVFTDPGSVPPNWNLDFDEERGETAPLSSSDFNSQMNPQQSMALGDTGNPRMRYCRKCNQLKPPRCHHCSVCKFIIYSSGWMLCYSSCY